MIKKILKDQGYTSGTQKRDVKLIQESEVYKEHPIIERVLNSLDRINPMKIDTESIKNTLLDLNIINQLKVTIKGTHKATISDVIDLDEVTSKVNSRLYGSSSQDHMGTQGLDLFPKSSKRDIKFKLI